MARAPGTRRGESFRRGLRGLPPTTRRVAIAGVVLGWLALWYVALLLGRRAVGDDDVSWAEPLSSMVGPLIGIALVLVAAVLLSAWAGFGWTVVVTAALTGSALVALLEFGSRRQSARIESLRDQVRGLPDRGPLTPGG